jgi:hypothetical protein
VLSSQVTDALPGDEDQIPPNGNPHPVNGHFLNQNQGNHFPGFFEDVGDLAQVQQANVDEGWEVAPQDQPQNNNNGWGQWIQQEGEHVDENELMAVDQLAEAVVANAVAAAAANAGMQNGDLPQHSASVNSETTTFFRAQGPPITLELPLPEKDC